MIAADGDLTRLICDPTTEALLDDGRTRYRPPDILRDFVHTRDRTCVTPGCRAPAARTDTDHVKPFKPGETIGGATDVDNLASVCRHHHRAKDGGGGRLRHHPRTGNWTWTTPLGRTYTDPSSNFENPPTPAKNAHDARRNQRLRTNHRRPRDRHHPTMLHRPAHRRVHPTTPAAVLTKSRAVSRTAFRVSTH